MNKKNNKIIYLDHAATTPLSPDVKKEMDFVLENIYGNPSSLHAKGYEAKVVLDGAREKIAKILNARADEIIFTSGGTESDNLAIFGYARANKRKDGKSHIIVSAIEHHAVLEPAHKLEKEGFEVDYLTVSKNGIVDLGKFKKLLRPETILVSIMYANNEIGTIQPIKEISKIIAEFNKQNDGNIIFHTDACQTAGALDLNVKNLEVDMMTINAGKIYGPKGIGLLYIKKGLPAGRQGLSIEPIMIGGGQEFGLRAGTENVAAIVGFAKALEIAQAEKEKESVRLVGLRDYAIDKILSGISKTKLNGDAKNRLPNNINISFAAIEGEALILYLDQAGIYASTGSACTSKSLEPSHVILALGEPHEVAHSSLRLTLGHSTQKEDLDYVIEVLPEIVKKLRIMSPIKS